MLGKKVNIFLGNTIHCYYLYGIEIKVMKKELLEYCYKYQKQWLYESGSSQREFDCLIHLVESDTITTYEELAEYGMEF